jgi:hypothetical protein
VRLGGLQVNDELVFGRLLERQLTSVLAAQNTVDIASGTAVEVYAVDTIEHQPAAFDEHRLRIHRRETV